jgi:basic membrane lipoprotein Med (substrate-binding protein (PBP1-ABC) superfamily)
VRRGGILWLLALLVAGCGGGTTASSTTTVTRTADATVAHGFPVGVVGPLLLDVQGVAVQRGTLERVAGNTLVLADARSASVDEVAAVARDHPSTHFAIVGASAKAAHVPNLAGIVLREDDAAYLAGIAAGLAADDESGTRVAWVGHEERKLARPFGRGVRAAAPEVAVLHQWSAAIPARCKEAALTAFDRGAVVVMARGGLCAAAAADAAHAQNLPALRLRDFLLPSVAAGLVARDASRGVFHGGEDVIFGADTGAVGVRELDPRISITTAAHVRATAQDLARGAASAG